MPIKIVNCVIIYWNVDMGIEYFLVKYSILALKTREHMLAQLREKVLKQKQLQN